MAKFNVTVSHILKRTVVIDRLRDFSVRVRNDAPIQVTELREEWDEEGNLSFSFVAMGFKISGDMVTCDQHVKISGQMPFAVSMFRGAIETQIADKIREAIET